MVYVGDWSGMVRKFRTTNGAFTVVACVARATALRAARNLWTIARSTPINRGTSEQSAGIYSLDRRTKTWNRSSQSWLTSSQKEN
jgi:hypothetical protein